MPHTRNRGESGSPGRAARPPVPPREVVLVAFLVLVSVALAVAAVQMVKGWQSSGWSFAEEVAW